MERIIDIHAHILPGIDDGATDRAEAIQLLHMAYEQGIRTIIATPHYSRRQHTDEIRAEAVWLQEEAYKLAPDFRIVLGQEIMYFDSVVENLKAGHALTIAGSHHILVEFMPDTKYRILYQAVRKLFQNGYHPIIAHVERYEALRIEENLQELMETGCYLQMNYKSLTGGFWDKNTRWCRRQIQAGSIHCMGTDMHGSVHRTPEIGKALDWLNTHVDGDRRMKLLYGNAEMILNNH